MIDTDSNLENANNDACLEHKEVIEEQLAVEEEATVINQVPIVKGSQGH